MENSSNIVKFSPLFCFFSMIEMDVNEDDPAFLKSIAQAQLAQAHTILAKVDALQKSKGTQIIGLPKFRKRVKAELEFLQSVSSFNSKNQNFRF